MMQDQMTALSFAKVFQQVAAVHRMLSRQAKAMSKLRSARDAAEQANRHVLVEEDGLSFAVQLAGKQPDNQKKDVAITEIVIAFRAAFRDVWAKIPEKTRRQLLGYWKSNPCRILSEDQRSRFPLPSIKVSDDVSWSEAKTDWATGFGCVLNFPESLIVENLHLARWHIACTLATACRFMTGEVPRLALSLLDGPYEAWENREGLGASEEACDQKWEELLVVYRRRCDGRITRIVRSWKITKPASAPPKSSKTR